jgi:hypothetical protein
LRKIKLANCFVDENVICFPNNLDKSKITHLDLTCRLLEREIAKIINSMLVLNSVTIRVKHEDLYLESLAEIITVTNFLEKIEVVSRIPLNSKKIGHRKLAVAGNFPLEQWSRFSAELDHYEIMSYYKIGSKFSTHSILEAITNEHSNTSYSLKVYHHDEQFNMDMFYCLLHAMTGTTCSFTFYHLDNKLSRLTSIISVHSHSGTKYKKCFTLNYDTKYLKLTELDLMKLFSVLPDLGVIMLQNFPLTENLSAVIKKHSPLCEVW